MATKTDAYDRANRQLNWGSRLLGLWLALVSFFFLQQSLNYHGLIARIAEIEFLHFDRYWPTFTFLALTTLCTAPLVIILWIIRARQRRNERLGPARIDDYRIMLGRVGRLQGFFAGISLGCLIGAGFFVLQMVMLPSDRYDPRSIVIGSPDSIGPADGRAVLTGSVDVGETSQFNEDLILVRRTLYFAPIRSGPDDKSPLRYFVQVRRNDVRGPYNPIVFPKGDDLVHAWRFRVKGISFTPYLDGVLQRGGLPGEIANLYRYAGYDVDRDNYVLYESNAPIRWRLQTLAGEFVIVAILAALVALYFARRRRHVRKLARAEAEGETATATGTGN